jgi:ribonuclease HIII
VSQPPSYAVPEGLRRLLDREGVELAGSRPIDHGTQYDLARGAETAKLNVYRTGKISTGGRASGLRDLLEGWRNSRGGAGGGQTSGIRAGGRPVLDGTPRVGIDEAGKGDYFGPLVVAGVRITGERAAKELRELGVRDSKTIGVVGIRGLAERVLGVIGERNVRIVSLPPKEYEARRGAAGNVNKLLGEVDAEIMGELDDEVEVIVVDEFAPAARSYLEPFVPEGVRLEVRTRAEDDAAVAAASIVARARQLDEVDRLSERIGFKLPLGATHVIGAGRRVVEELGEEGLAEVAKISFATTQKVLGTSENGDGGRP